jgi:hypothetical protein
VLSINGGELSTMPAACCYVLLRVATCTVCVLVLRVIGRVGELLYLHEVSIAGKAGCVVSRVLSGDVEYGVKDMPLDADSKIRMWLPASSDSVLTRMLVDGEYYGVSHVSESSHTNRRSAEPM